MRIQLVRTVGRWSYRLLQRLMTLDVTHLMILESDKLQVLPHSAGNVDFRFLSPDEIRRFAHDPENNMDDQLAERVNSGLDFCAAAVCDGRLASYAWCALGSIEGQFNRGGPIQSGTSVSFGRRMGFFYKGFTHPDFRGRRLFQHVHAFALQQLATRGVTAMLSTADWTNTAALRGCYGQGFRYLGCIWRFGWGRHVAGIYPQAAKSYGIKLGDQAVVHPRSGRTETRFVAASTV